MDLQSELRPVKEESLIIHAMRLILELDSRSSSPLYQHLQSPMRQTLYMVDVYYSIDNREESVEVDNARWIELPFFLTKLNMSFESFWNSIHHEAV